MRGQVSPWVCVERPPSSLEVGHTRRRRAASVQGGRGVAQPGLEGGEVRVDLQGCGAEEMEKFRTSEGTVDQASPSRAAGETIGEGETQPSGTVCSTDPDNESSRARQVRDRSRAATCPASCFQSASILLPCDPNSTTTRCASISCGARSEAATTAEQQFHQLTH